MKDAEQIYIDFASKASFFEFMQEEFRSADIPTSNLQNEIAHITSKKYWNITELSDFVRNNPKSFIIFEAIFQLLRFTNAQTIHFTFDVTRLNSENIENIYEYMILNLKHDDAFRKVYLNLVQPKLSYDEFIGQLDNMDKKYLVATFKIAISKYIDMVSKNVVILEKRMSTREFEDCSIRFANYLLNNLRLNEALATIDVKKFLQNKRIPLDTKSLHGNYAKLKIMKVLSKRGYSNVDNLLKQKSISLERQVALEGKGKVFCTEKYIEGIVKPKDSKPKKFDFIIFRECKPKYLLEANFYSTEGTKIGINQDEYIDLNDYIKDRFPQCSFYWVTDGNYWLTSQGKSRFINLLRYFDKIFNINTFSEAIDNFLT